MESTKEIEMTEQVTVEQVGRREFAIKVGEVVHHYATGTREQADADAARLARAIAFDATR